ncbi:MAG: nucleotidyltransferase family protein [Clostridia bacterium]|nr:nucleotidyltransferase family protein [Clostridia bacterium]
MSIRELLFVLIKCSIDGIEPSEEAKKALDVVDLATLFKVAKHHDVCHLVGHALIEGNLIRKDNPLYMGLEEQIGKAVFRCERIAIELGEITRVLEAGQIKHIPLKGAVIRGYYRESWMRPSCDIDILVEEKDLKKACRLLKDELSYTSDDKVTYHDVSLFSPSGVHLELHYNIRENIESLDRVLMRPWDYSREAEGFKYSYKMREEYLIFHLIAHTAYHFLKGGCGIRPVIDLYTLKKNISYNCDTLSALLEETELTKFYKELSHLTEYWLEGKEPNDTTKKMEKYILLGGVYGTKENVTATGQAKKGKTGNLFSKIFVSYEALVGQFPVLKKWKILTPVFQIVRWFKVLFSKGIKKTAKEVKASTAHLERTEEIKEMLKELEL